MRTRRLTSAASRRQEHDRLYPRDRKHPATLKHEALKAWVAEIANLTQPDRIHWADGSEAVCGEFAVCGTSLRKFQALSDERWLLRSTANARLGQPPRPSANRRRQAHRPGGTRALVAASLLVKHQPLVLNRSRRLAPNLRSMDRIIAGLCAVFMRPGRLIPARMTEMRNLSPGFDAAEAPSILRRS